MAFESLSEKLNQVFKSLKSRGRLNEKDVQAAMREIKLVLLEADVNFRVVKQFIARVSEKAVGSDVLESLTPGQQVIKIVRDELIETMGSTQAKITYATHPPTVLMMCGLQGAGKTTSTAKLGGWLQKQGKRPLLVACDIYRPAAIKQLQVVGGQLGLPVFCGQDGQKPPAIAKAAVEHAKLHGNDVVLLDTAGRLHIDDVLMDELKTIKQEVNVWEILLVVDAMTGQDAVSVASSFHEQLGIDGIIMTKLDGDTRGGSALSVKAVTGQPIKFVGMGEKLDELEPFHPDRMASRMLGMGDVLTLIEKAEATFDQQKAVELEKKLRTQQFTFDDFLDQLDQMKNMGPMSQLLTMIPGVDAKALKNVDLDEKKFAHVEAIIRSMTPKERTNPSIINASRKQRIANGSGVPVQEVNALLKQFEQMQKMMKQFSNPKKFKKGNFRFPF